jgi:hypothetical protein
MSTSNVSESMPPRDSSLSLSSLSSETLTTVEEGIPPREKGSRTSLIVLDAIHSFVNDLAEVFVGDDKCFRPLELYCYLINKTNIGHYGATAKHAEAFTTFCVANREAILTKKQELLETSVISYSNKVYIDIAAIFDGADTECQNAIWKHLLKISALVDPTGRAKEVLRQTGHKAASAGGGAEANLLTDIISKVEEHVDPNASPMEAVSSMLQSGIFTDLISSMNGGMQDGSLDLSKLMSTVQSMVGSVSDQSDDEGGSDQTLNLINTMMSSMSAGSDKPTDGSGMPDISGILGALGGQGGGLGGLGGMAGLASLMTNTSPSSTLSIEEQIDAQVKQVKDKR